MVLAFRKQQQRKEREVRSGPKVVEIVRVESNFQSAIGGVIASTSCDFSVHHVSLKGLSFVGLEIIITFIILIISPVGAVLTNVDYRAFVSHLLRVKHPNILQLVDVFETKKEYFLFLEL